ncbi:hypothetical protein ACFY30_21220 [Streptomyces sp. NPDC000345]|uniref:hypothetical protein n=1 Tax=Streptomyces sp. NPDC000345 TaxID=3364537 RepID=UPI0036B2321E
MRRVAFVLAGLAAAGAATYLVVYLYWWQWQRALICGVLLLVVEVMLFGVVLLGRLTRIEQRLRDTDRRQREQDARHEDVHARLRQTPAELEEARFRWLADPADRTYVFVPVLMVTGVLLSGLAWVVQRIASATARPAEHRLAGRLAVLTAPDPEGPAHRHALSGTHGGHDGYDSHDSGHGIRDRNGSLGPYGPHDPYASYDPYDPYAPHPYAPLDLEDLPLPGSSPPSRGRTARVAVVGTVGAALLAGTVVGIAELTQTREEAENRNRATSVIVRVDIRGPDMTAARRTLAAEQVWERCRDSTSVPLRHAALGDLGDGLFAGTVRPALTEHDRLRLTGCLEDATLERAHLTVVGIGDADAEDG